MKKTDVDREAAEAHLRGFMKEIGLDPDGSVHMSETPRRVVDAYVDDFVEGMYDDVEIDYTTFPTEESKDFIIVDNIEVKSICQHHLVPFYGRAHVGYIPNGEIVGLSKVARLVDNYSRRPQVQERLTEQVASDFHDTTNAQATVVVMEAKHMCMSHRGVNEPNSVTRTSALRGRAQDEPEIKEEFMQLADLGI